jgi:hypothetical protein
MGWNLVIEGKCDNIFEYLNIFFYITSNYIWLERLEIDIIWINGSYTGRI